MRPARRAGRDGLESTGSIAIVRAMALTYGTSYAADAVFRLARTENTMAHDKIHGGPGQDAGGPGAGASRRRSFSVFGNTIDAASLTPGLYVAATPIGNLGDMTLRGLATLAAADAVLAEDTRVTRVLLSHYDIATPLIAYHEHNAAAMRPQILARLARGEALALVSDAGTPLISDPGFKLVAEATAAGHAVTTAPGASAVLAALVLGGLPTDRFFFEGFLPSRTSARRTRLAELAGIPATLVFFESARRLPEVLADLAAVLGSRPAAVARELTKKFETVRRGTVTALAELFADEGPPKGEVVILVGPPQETDAPAALDIDEKLAAALAVFSLKDAATVVAAETGLPRRDLYARALSLAAARREES